MSTPRGVDYSGTPPDPRAIRDAGYTFVCRYLSTPGNAKNITAGEARKLVEAGVDVVLVFERLADRPLGGRAAGEEDGLSARRQAAAVGAPPGTAIYAAVDFDPLDSEMPAVMAYLEGFRARVAPHPCGVYGGYRTIDRATADPHNAIPYRWQAGAWSTQGLHPKAQLKQHVGTVHVGGTPCDTNDALHPDYGGWLAASTEEDPLAGYTPEQLQDIVESGVRAALKPAMREGTSSGPDALGDVLDGVRANARRLEQLTSRLGSGAPVAFDAGKYRVTVEKLDG